jgi:hypothetical protein
LAKNKGDLHTMLTLNLCCAILAKTDTYLKYSLLRSLSNEFTFN